MKTYNVEVQAADGGLGYYQTDAETEEEAYEEAERFVEHMNAQRQYRTLTGVVEEV